MWYATVTWTRSVWLEKRKALVHAKQHDTCHTAPATHGYDIRNRIRNVTLLDATRVRDKRKTLVYKDLASPAVLGAEEFEFLKDLVPERWQYNIQRTT